ncbi:MAG: patatin-like phospholipase family protein [Pyrinomonadaceae bacterium]|nr:patatin-like phospholipase family protein [Pyrinomonadaceae bacterium]MCX7639928.1 patatin-like phospholipase family protein [Pyrinomonadaceae bacterium]MDW8304100.1 patatin-like phospholipase family protein [Acidobacteriota bacterium]
MDEAHKQRKKIGLALSGGAARGYAHLGVIKVLLENQIPIDYIAGTSAGSIVGAALACELSIEKIIEIGSKMNWLKIAKFSYSTKGLLTNEPLGDFLRQHLPYHKFEDLPKPFAAVACDIETGEEVVFKDRGDLITAIRASCAVPGVFSPVEYNGKTLVDGGITSIVPVKAVRQLGAEVVIAVDVNASGASYWGKPSTFLGILFQSAMMLIRTAGKHQHYEADIVITPNVSHLRPDEIGKMQEFIKAGEKAALEKLSEIRKLIDLEKVDSFRSLE